MTTTVEPGVDQYADVPGAEDLPAPRYGRDLAQHLLDHQAQGGPDAARHTAQQHAAVGRHVHLVSDGETRCLRGGCRFGVLAGA